MGEWLSGGGGGSKTARNQVLVALAMLNVATLGAGVAVAVFLPARLALWQVPRVTGRPVTAGTAALAPARPTGAMPTPAGLSAALAPLLRSPALGHHVGVAVSDLASGTSLFTRDASSGFAPASTEKLATAAAALSVLGPSARFTTRVVTGPRPGTVVLVGGGDPTLAAGQPPRRDYPQPATLASLAGASAQWLRSHGQGQQAIRVEYDTALFTGPLTAPGWTPSYVSTGNVTPITSLEVDQGRLTPGGRPEDADNPDNFRARSSTPAPEAAAAFGALLRARGLRVVARPVPAATVAGSATIASVQSPPLTEIVDWMLRESNNVIAEDLARQVAIRLHQPATFGGGAAAVMATLRRLGVGGVHLVDGSGLSPRDRITPAAMVRVVRLAAGPAHPQLRPIVAGLPVAGFSGTLAPGQSVFAGFTPAALGRVQAKTGNLTQVVSLAGIVDDTSGRLLAFALMADRLRPRQLTNGAKVIDGLASALAHCGC